MFRTLLRRGSHLQHRTVPGPTCVFTQFETAGGDMHVTGYQTCYGGEQRRSYHGNHFLHQTTNVDISHVFFVSCLRRHQRPCLSTGNGVLRAFMGVLHCLRREQRPSSHSHIYCAARRMKWACSAWMRWFLKRQEMLKLVFISLFYMSTHRLP